MTPTRARLAVAGVFLLGFLAGAATLQVVRARIERRVLDAPDPVARLVVYKLAKDLRLDAGQRREVYRMVTESRAELLTVRADVFPILLEIFERTQGRIREVLTPEQRVKFDRIVAERRRIFSTFGEGAAEPQR